MAQRRAAAKKKLPEFASIQEAAEFFDTHSAVDYIDESPDEATVEVLDEDPGILVPVRLDSETYAILKDRARAMKISPASLARRMLVEKLCDS